MAKIGFNFRSTLLYVTDAATDVGVIGDLYPTVRNGQTFGWLATFNDFVRNRSTAVDVRLAGMHFEENSLAAQSWRVDLPGGPGQYDIHWAQGDATGARANARLRLLDGVGGATLIDREHATLSSGQFGDAAGTKWTAAQWPGSEQAVRVTVTADHLVVVLGGPVGGTTDVSVIAHLAIESVAASGVTTTGTTTGTATVTGVGQTRARTAGTATGGATVSGVGQTTASSGPTGTGSAAFAHLLTAPSWRFAPGWAPDPIEIRALGRGSVLTAGVDGESRGTLEVPITAPGYDQLTPGKIVTIVWANGTWEEYRLVEVTDTGASTGLGVFALAGYASILADAGLVREDTADGARRYVFDRPGLTATEHLASTVLALLTDVGVGYVALGDVTVTGRRDISYRADHGLAALQAIATAWGAEYEVRADVAASLYRIDVVPQRNGGVFGGDLSVGHNAGLTRTRSRVEQINAVVPLLADGSTIAEARWRVSALTGTTLTLADPNGGDGPIREDGQLNGLWVEAADLVTRVQITATSAALQRVTVASTAGFAAESRVRIVRTNTGAWLTELTSPSAIAASGRKGGVLPLPDLAGVNNLIVNPVMAAYASPAAAPDGWSVLGAVTLTRTATVGFTALGGFSARCQTTVAGAGLVTPSAPLPISALRPFVSGAVSLRVETGEVRVELVATDGVTTWVFPDGAQKAIPAQRGLLTTMVLSGWDLDTLGATSAWLRVVQEGAAAADYYVDAAQLVVSTVPIAQISEGDDATRAWQRGNLHLDLYAPVRVRYDARVTDLARLDGTAFPDHALVLGGTHRVVDPVLGVADGLRVVQITRRVLVEAETTVAISNRPEDLISLASRRDPVARAAGNNPVTIIEPVADGPGPGPSLEADAITGTTNTTIIWSGPVGTTVAIDGGTPATPAASPFVVTRPAVGALARSYRFSATANSQTVVNTVTVLPLTATMSGRNLVLNGDAEQPREIGWGTATASWVRALDDPNPVSGSGVWEVAQNGAEVFADEMIAVDATAEYELSVQARRVAFGSGATLYVGLESFDRLSRQIAPIHVNAPNGLGSTSTLAAAVNGGATTVSVVNAAGFPSSGFVALNTQTDGSDLPNFSTQQYVSKAGNVLTLAAPWPGTGQIAAAGTNVRLHADADGLVFAAARAVGVGTIPTTFTLFRGLVTGTAPLGTVSTNQFRTGTAFVRPVILANIGGTGTNVIRFDDVFFSPVEADTVTPDLTVVPGVHTATQMLFVVSASNPKPLGAAPTITAQPKGTSTSSPAIADGASGAVTSGATVTVNRSAFNGLPATITFTASLSGGGSEIIQRTVLPQGIPLPSISTQVTQGPTSYSVAYTAVGTVEQSLNGGAWVTAEDSPVVVARNLDGGDAVTLSLRATSAGQTVAAGTVTVLPQDPAPPAGGSVTSFNVASTSDAADTITLAFTLDSPPAGFTLDLEWFRDGSDGGTTLATITGIGTSSPYVFAAGLDLVPKGTTGREFMKFSFVLRLKNSGGTLLSSRPTSVSVGALVPA